ncbi:MAG: hypothetical protein QOE28_3058 [Solirubrobacteraceae bacterium]|nr:hypothetical protein [Solirubrobacteraceae bacterium]
MGDPAVEIIDTPEAGTAVIRGGAIRTVAWSLGLLISVASAPLLVRHLGIVAYGRYLTILAVVQTIALIADNALANLALREYTSQPQELRASMLRNLLGLRLLLTVVGLALGFGFAVAAGYDHTQLAGLALAGGALFVFDYVGAFQAPLAVALRIGWISVVELVRNLVAALATIALVLGGAGLLPFYGVNLLAAIAAFAVVAMVAGRNAPWMPRADLATWRPLLRDVLPIAAATTFSSLYFRVVLLVASIVGTAQVLGDFSVSFRIMEIAVSIPLLLVATAFPVIVRAADTDRRRLEYALARIVEVGLLAGGWMSLVIVLTAELGVLIVSGHTPHATVEALRLQGLTLPANFLIAGWGYALLSLREHRKLLVSNAAAFVTAVVLAIVLVPWLGAPGGGVAILVTEVLLAAIYGVQLRRLGMHLDVSRRTVAIGAVAAVASLGVGALIPAPEPVGAALATLLYAGILLKARAVPPELLAALPGRGAPADPAPPDPGSGSPGPAGTPSG